jgi:hypothetical protein
MVMVNDELIQEYSYEVIKGIIRGKLSSVAESFVSIGYQLKQVRDKEMYKEDGYEDIWEFAEQEFSLSQPSASRFMNINDKYSVDGNGILLLPQYAGYGWSKLSEMLSLTDEQLKLVSDKTTRVEIREIKKVVTEVAEAENEVYAHAHKTEESHENTQSENSLSDQKKYVIPDAQKFMIGFFRPKANREIMKEIANMYSITSTFKLFSDQAAELINPSGHLMFKQIPVILMFEEDHIKYNSFGKPTVNYTYYDFFSDMIQVFDLSLPDPWVAFYGEPEPDPIPEPEKPKQVSKPEVKPTPMKPEVKKETKPAPREDSRRPEPVNADSILPGQLAIDDYPELDPERSEEVQEDNSWQQDQEDSQDTEQIINEPEADIEICEADIVHTEDIKVDHEIKVIYNEDAGEVEVHLDGSRGINIIRVIDTSTGESWEVDISEHQ